MDAFETVVAAILQSEGFWTRTSVKVELTKEEKREIGRPTSPRWELDVVGYRGSENEVRVVECRSFLDSAGVKCAAFDGSRPDLEKRYKLFRDNNLRRVVLNRLTQQLVGAGFCAKDPAVQLCLAAGKISGDQDWLTQHFEDQEWLLYTPDRLRDELRQLSDRGYENDVATIVSKLLQRDLNVKPKRR